MPSLVKTTLSILFGLTASLAALSAESPAWPQFRGPSRQGIAQGPGPLTWTKDSGIAWKVIWKKQVSYKPMHGNGSSPVIVGDKLVVNADAEVDPTIVAFHKEDGSIAWRIPRNQPVKSYFSFSTPVVVKTDGRTEIISPGSGLVGAYAPDDGKLLWKVTYGEERSLASPALLEGALYLRTDENLWKITGK